MIKANAAGYLLVVDELPIIGYALQSFLDSELMNIQVIAFRDLRDMVNNKKIYNDLIILGVVADLIRNNEFMGNTIRIFAMEALFTNCPVFLFSTSIDLRIVTEMEKGKNSIVGYVHRLDSEKELFSAISQKLRNPQSRKLYYSKTIMAERKKMHPNKLNPDTQLPN